MSANIDKLTGNSSVGTKSQKYGFTRKPNRNTFAINSWKNIFFNIGNVETPLIVSSELTSLVNYNSKQYKNTENNINWAENWSYKHNNIQIVWQITNTLFFVEIIVRCIMYNMKLSETSSSLFGSCFLSYCCCRFGFFLTKKCSSKRYIFEQ